MITNSDYNPIKDKDLNSQIESVQESDVVAGWYFRKFIEAYKEYDQRQKEVIQELQKENRKLCERINKIKVKDIISTDADSKDKMIAEQRKHIAQLQHKLQRQKETLREMQRK